MKKKIKKLFVLGTVAMLCGTGCVSKGRNSVEKIDAELSESIQVIGQAEYVTVLPQGYRYRARIDTGATTCSISALDIEPFERDGEKWVRFRLPLPGKTAADNLEKSDLFEYPVVREARIKRHGAEDQIRPTIKLNVQLGEFEGRVEFTLTDRTKYEFPVLVGRNLLDGNAVVDVSLSYVAKEK